MSAEALGGLQRRLLAFLRGGGDAIRTDIAADARMPSATGLRIYAHAYGARLREALESDHEQLGRYLGDALWERLCAGYIAAHPSRYRSLRHFGTDLPAWLAAVPLFAAHPQIAELAALERMLLDCHDAPDAEPVAWDRLLALPPAHWPRLRLRFHPSLRRLSAQWNSVEIWMALKAEQTPPPAQRLAVGEWLLWRNRERVTCYRSLAVVERVALAHFLQGGDFAGLCERLLEWHAADAVPTAALALLRRWADEGVVTRWVGVDEPGPQAL